MSEKDDNGLRREFETLQEILEEKMKTMKAENEAAISKNHAAATDALAMNSNAIERLRADMERGLSTTANKIMVAMGVGFAFLGGVIAYVGLFAGGS